MSDLGDEVRNRVKVAKEFDRRQREERRQQAEEQAALEDRRMARAKELNDKIGKRLRDFANEADEGELKYAPGLGLEHFLEWHGPPPARTLEVDVDHLSGRIEWRWSQGGKGKMADVLEFRMEELDDAIHLLIDQAAWSGGRIPKMP
jgi:hypothetical protein